MDYKVAIKRLLHKIALLRREIGLGALVSIVIGLTYFLALHEPGPAFYPFAGLACLGGPLLGGIVALVRTQHQRFIAFLTSAGAVLGIVFLSFVFAYAVLTQFARRHVQLPPYCDGWDGRFN